MQCAYRQEIPIARRILSGYFAGMNKFGTIADVTRWAEETLPGEESRARSVIVGCRKAGLFTKGGHGKNAPYMRLDDFPTAILAVLHPGQVTQVHEALIAYFNLPMKLIEIDDPAQNPIQILPENLESDELARPYFARFNLPPLPFNLLATLAMLFAEYAPRSDFWGGDHIELQTAGDKVAVRIVLNGGYRVNAADPWGSGGPENSQLILTFGDINVFNSRAVKTTRTIYAEALNALSLMTPNLTKTQQGG